MESRHRLVAYARLIDQVRAFNDNLAGARLDASHSEELRTVLARESTRLALAAVEEGFQDFSNHPNLPCRAQSMTPWFEIVEQQHDRLRANVRFGRAFRGLRVVHGGAIPLLFDDLMGTLASWERSSARTVNLNVDYRSMTPVDVMLDFVAIFVSEQGRKRILSARLLHEGELCAEASGLFIETAG